MFWRTVFIDLLVFLLCFHFRRTSKKSQVITQKIVKNLGVSYLQIYKEEGRICQISQTVVKGLMLS